MNDLIVLLSVISGLILIGVTLYVALHKRRCKRVESDLSELKLLCSLLADMQRHRGLSSAVLSGDNSLQSELDETRNRIARVYEQAKTLMETFPESWRNLLNGWNLVSETSRYSREENLLNHHRLIREIIYLIEDIASNLDINLSQDERKQLNYIWHETLQVAEWAGQARALGTSVAAEHKSTAAQRIRLKFLHQKIVQQSDVAFEVLSSTTSSGINSSPCQQKVAEFLFCLESELLDVKQPEIDAREYFDKATAAINELLSMVDVTLHNLQREHLSR